MKRVKRWRYYCEFCKKSGGNGWHMKRHEMACTNNPSRKCGMCGASGSKVIQELIKVLEQSAQGDEFNIFVNDLTVFRNKANGCPACMLAALRQSPEIIALDFNFSEEKKRFWDEVNRGNYDDSKEVYYER